VLGALGLADEDSFRLVDMLGGYVSTLQLSEADAVTPQFFVNHQRDSLHSLHKFLLFSHREVAPASL
jgi:hypothetical protein